MKFALPFGCLVAGIAIGWFAKPSDSAEGHAASSPAATSSPTAQQGTAANSSKPADASREGASGSRPARPEIDASKAKVQAKAEEAGKKMQEQMSKRMTDIQRKKFEARFAKLVTELNLSPEQQAKIRATMEERFTKMGELFTFDGSGDNADKMKDLSALMKSDGLDEAAAAQLTEDQKAGFEAIKGKERQSRIEAKALKDLGNISTVLELSQEQKDAVYGVFSEQAAKKEETQKSAGMMNLFTEGMGVQFDDEFGMSDLIQEQMETHGGGPPDADVKKTLAATIKQRTEDRVEALRPILNEQQLQQYRTHLETKAAGMMNMFGGMEEEPGK